MLFYLSATNSYNNIVNPYKIGFSIRRDAAAAPTVPRCAAAACSPTRLLWAPTRACSAASAPADALPCAAASPCYGTIVFAQYC